jgi:regulator of sigma E protease
MRILILTHELAHLAVALAMGVKVEVFSLGFGRRLFGCPIRGIDFRLSARCPQKRG